MASSTTIPIANTNANMVSVLMVKPKGIKNIKVPMRDTGIARTGMSVALQLCKNKNTTSTTNVKASSNVITTSLIEAFTTETVSNGTK